MCSYLDSINLIRYLLVWRVNSSLVRLPLHLSAELSFVLGKIIAERLPTGKARDWRKALAAWEAQRELRPPKNEHHDETSDRDRNLLKSIPETSWPVESVLFTYPGKTTYGKGELILWELKLMGENADHGFFLEVILPAMEEAGYTSDSRWNRPNRLWGRFDIQSIYVARGPNWEPLVSDGRLDLRYRATPVQWKEGLTFSSGPELKYGSPTRLIWLTPFDLADSSCEKDDMPATRNVKGKSHVPPTLQCILEALERRMSLLIPDLRNVPNNTRDAIRMEGQLPIQNVIEQMERVPMLHHDLKNAPKNWPGHRVGTQMFSYIPSPIIPYLELASIFHIGRHTHFGCGTFTLIRSTSDIV